MKADENVIHSTLLPLVGLRLSWIGNAASMRTFGFGSDDIEVKTRTGGHEFTSPYALHVQCPWRLTKESMLITGSNDWWYPEVGPWHPEWDPAEGGSLQQAILRRILRDDDLSRRVLFNQSALLTVMAVEVGDANGFTLLLSPDYRLTVFPSGTREEQWRLLNSRSGRHDYLVESRLHCSEIDDTSAG